MERIVPIVNNTNELEKYIHPLYIIEDYLGDYEIYRNFQDDIYNILKGCFDIKKCREYPIKFKFYKTDRKTYSMQLRHFIFNLFLWLPFVELSEFNALNEDYIFKAEDIIKLTDYIDNKLINIMDSYHLKSKIKNVLIASILDDCRRISNDFGLYLGIDMSAKTFIDLYNNNDNIQNMMNTTFDETKQPYEIEQESNEIQKRLINELENIPGNNPLKMIIKSKSGIKYKQLFEFMISGGLKPTLDGKTVQIVLQNSTLIGGTNKPSYYYLDAMGGRKASILNKMKMGISGYYCKSVPFLARTLEFDLSVDNCGTKHLVEYNVKNEKVLKKLDGKYFSLKENGEFLSLLDAKSRTDLIGQTIYVRSPATCALENHVCAKCLGKIWSNLENINQGMSVMLVEEWTKVINQQILSSKHLLTTNSEVVVFSENFEKFFTVISGEIMPNLIDNEYVENIEDYAIYIPKESIEKVDEMDDDSLYNTVLTGDFYIKNLKDPDAELIPITMENDKDIYIASGTLELMDKKTKLIKFKDLSEDVKLFEIDIKNNELTKPLYDIMHLTNKKDKNGDKTINSMCQKFMDLFIESNIGANAITYEILVNRLIYSKADPYRRPNFKNKTLEPYGIQTVSKALENNPSPLLGLSYQNIKRQLLSNNLYSKRNKSSYVDEYFRTEFDVKEVLEELEMKHDSGDDFNIL